MDGLIRHMWQTDRISGNDYSAAMNNLASHCVTILQSPGLALEK